MACTMSIARRYTAQLHCATKRSVFHPRSRDEPQYVDDRDLEAGRSKHRDRPREDRRRHAYEDDYPPPPPKGQNHDDLVVTTQTQTTKAHHHQGDEIARTTTPNVAVIAIETIAHHRHRQQHDPTLPQRTSSLHHAPAAIATKRNGRGERVMRISTTTTPTASVIQSVMTTDVAAPKGTIPTASTTDGDPRRIPRTVA
ncbi:hypothetical protein BDV96DRAFT_349342 [Lophiotrema nucula]|uniref:Uncharacterized protein n=1 Tax=Lophiotrema nucula TaxID=690887 RepID=A0A6A5ZL63_9PLEO|nr:hypothetical protein BDV96DRAFT_349342 [Lophiotrema nucula]